MKLRILLVFQFSSVQSLSHVRLFATPWTAALQDSLSIATPGVYSNSCPLSWWAQIAKLFIHIQEELETLLESETVPNPQVAFSSCWISSFQIAMAVHFRLSVKKTASFQDSSFPHMCFCVCCVCVCVSVCNEIDI